MSALEQHRKENIIHSCDTCFIKGRLSMLYDVLTVLQKGRGDGDE